MDDDDDDDDDDEREEEKRAGLIEGRGAGKGQPRRADGEHSRRSECIFCSISN